MENWLEEAQKVFQEQAKGKTVIERKIIRYDMLDELIVSLSEWDILEGFRQIREKREKKQS